MLHSFILKSEISEVSSNYLNSLLKNWPDSFYLMILVGTHSEFKFITAALRAYFDQNVYGLIGFTDVYRKNDSFLEEIFKQ